MLLWKFLSFLVRKEVYCELSLPKRKKNSGFFLLHKIRYTHGFNLNFRFLQFKK